MRVAPPRVAGAAAGAPRPPAGSPGADAHRQTGFVLGAEIDAVIAGLDLEGEAATASAGAKFRRQPTASAMLMWSRGWLSRLEALHAGQCGNYAAAIPLVRAAADYLAAAVALLETDTAEWQDWVDSGGVSLAPDAHALEYRLHPFRSAEALARYPVLGRVYRHSSDLAMPHFGATLLVAGHDSTPDRIAATFGDRDFHLGLAEIVLGWLLDLGAEQLRLLERHPQSFALPGPAATAWMRSAGEALARADRCGISDFEREGARRLLISGWRTRPGDAARRILL